MDIRPYKFCDNPTCGKKFFKDKEKDHTWKKKRCCCLRCTNVKNTMMSAYKIKIMREEKRKQKGFF